MFLKSLALWAAAVTALVCATAAPAQTLTTFPLKGADGSTYQECAYSDGSKLYMCHLLYGWTGSAPKAWTMDANGYGGVNVFSSALPAGGATSAAQATENGTLASILTALTPAGGLPVAGPLTATQLAAAGLATAGGKIDTVIASTSTNRGASFTTAAAVTIMPANAARRGLAIQNQGTTNCYESGVATATADFNSLLIPAGGLYESGPQHAGTGAISVICPGAASTAVPIFAREF